MRVIVFENKAFEQYKEWINIDKKVAMKISSLILEMVKTPFTGLGIPEPLKGNFKGYWSRRIDEKNRIIYKVSDLNITIASCKNHYNEK